MDKNINIDHKLIEYIFSHTRNLHPVQKELIKYNESLGHIKRLQISVLQANFLQFLIKSRNINNCLEIGTFTGYSTLSMALSLNKNGKILTIDKDKETDYVQGATYSAYPGYYGRGFRGYYGAYGGMIQEPGYYTTTNVFVLQFNFYQLNNPGTDAYNALVWTVQDKVDEPSNPEKFTSKYCEKLVESMKADGII